MAGSPELALLENSLQILGAFVGFSIGYVAYRGYRETKSPSLLRLSIAFFLLFSGFFASGVIGFSRLNLLPALTFTAPAFIIPAALLETVGYFFLALSYAINVRSARRLYPFVALPAVAVDAVLKSLSVYFLLYGVVEAILAYAKTKKTVTAVIGAGLGLLALGELIRWTSYLYPPGELLILMSLIIRVVGLASLFIPVVKFSMHRGGSP